MLGSEADHPRAHPKVTVYVTNHNYGGFVRQAIESVLHQTFQDWELIIIDDGSSDGSQVILREYERLPNVHLVFQENKGLTVSSNIALRLSKGEYIMRLDADDYLDEHALLVLSTVLDTKPWVGLVYPDFYRVDERGEILGLERRNKIGKEITLYDIPAHGACTMIRKSCLQALGGYSEEITCQDGYDLWVQFIDRFGIDNVNTPLFYYRQHRRSLSADKARLLRTRRTIKRRHVEGVQQHERLNVIGIVPVRGRAADESAYALRPIAGRALIDYTIDAALRSEALKQLVVVSEDPDVLAHARTLRGVTVMERPAELARPNTPITPTVKLVLSQLDRAARPDAFMLLYVNCPLRSEAHIRHAIDTMSIFDSDSVISVYEDLTTHYQHIGSGLKPLFPRRALRLEKEGLWVENGALYLAKVKHLSASDYLGERIGHIVMLERESLQIDTEEDFLLVEHLLGLQKRTSAVTANVE